MKLKLTDKRHSPRGIFSFVISLFLIGFFVSSIIFLAFVEEANTFVLGIMGMICFVLGIVGILLGTNELNDDEIYKTYPILGIVINIIMIGLFGYTYIIGL